MQKACQSLKWRKKQGNWAENAEILHFLYDLCFTFSVISMKNVKDFSAWKWALLENAICAFPGFFIY